MKAYFEKVAGMGHWNNEKVRRLFPSVAWGAIMPFTAIRMDSSMKSMNGSELFRILDSAKAE